MTRVAALRYSGESPRPVAVELTRGGDTLHVTELQGRAVRSYPVGVCEVDPRLGTTRRAVRFPDGSEVHVDDNDGLDALLPSRTLEARVERLERRWQAAAAAALVAIAAIGAGVIWGLPWAADRVARVIPAAVEAQMGRQVEKLLDRMGFDASTLEAARRDGVARSFERLVAELPSGRDYRLRFLRLGFPNAFALPGGTVIMGDELVAALGDDDEAIAAVLAHEIGHLEHRHVLRSVLQDSAIVVAVAFFTGDVSSAGALTVAIPTFLLESHYSRGFETEADDFAFAMLRQTGGSPAAFARAMRALTKASGDKDVDEGLGYLSSHPSNAERIARAEAAVNGDGGN